MRVYEYAKKMGLSSKELLSSLADAGFDILNHMVVLSDDEISFLDRHYAHKNKNNEQQPSAQEEVSPSVGDVISEQHIEEAPVRAASTGVAIVLEPMTIADLAHRLSKPSTELIILLLKWGIMTHKNQLLNEEMVAKVARHFEASILEPAKKAEQGRMAISFSDGVNVESRLPVIVVVGHVDHGKTTLLDFIRKTRVAAREKGGITQHLGAYHVETKHGGIVFLDTPGHEAFSKIRSRGVKVADIVILVVAADDGVMPQTVEAIKFAKAMNVPIIVAINKIDKVPPARLDVIKRQLAEQNLLPEEWGGETVIVPISAKNGTGVDELLEMVDLQAQLLELRADVVVAAKGYVLESKMEKGRGAVATILLQQGYLHIGDYFVVDNVSGKVSSMVDSHGSILKKVGPSHPVLVAGFDQLPNAGDFFEVISKDQAKKAVQNKPAANSQQRAVSKEKAINLVIKTDTNSSKEALEDAIKKLSKKISHMNFHIVASGIGDISERDILLAAHTKSSIVGLHVKPIAGAVQIAQQLGVAIELFDIIYKLLEELERRAEGVKEIKMIDKKIGEGVIRKVFDIKKVGIIAGCQVKDGIFSKNGKMVIWRNKYKIGSGSITSLQRDGKNIKEVHAGFECAFMAEGLHDFAPDDRVECYISVPENKA